MPYWLLIAPLQWSRFVLAWSPVLASSMTIG